jgi:hypothetical protein
VRRWQYSFRSARAVALVLPICSLTSSRDNLLSGGSAIPANWPILQSMERRRDGHSAKTFGEGGSMRMKTMVSVFAATGLLGGCENMSTAQKGAMGGAALGTGIGMVTGGSFGTVVGAGLIGGGVGYLSGTALENRAR